ncbi:YtxH domain-containing protein [Fictibacillus iocasae]|uniref:YtxH domain-containing protein n=1 Tax=Fictibacillus iocasae TaxID=2715437 RepID=A0ABW2NW70_9BACL
MSKKKSAITGFAIGTVVTAAATLLSTPKAGKEVRQDLKKGMDKVKTSISNVKKEGILLKDRISFAKKEQKEAMEEVAADTVIEEMPKEKK